MTKACEYLVTSNMLSETINASDLKDGKCYMIVGCEDESIEKLQQKLKEEEENKKKDDENNALVRKFRIITGIDETTASTYIDSCQSANTDSTRVLEVIITLQLLLTLCRMLLLDTTTQ
jgi:hypothetical protein